MKILPNYSKPCIGFRCKSILSGNSYVIVKDSGNQWLLDVYRINGEYVCNGGTYTKDVLLQHLKDGIVKRI